MDKFLEKFSLMKLTQKEIENLNSVIFLKDIRYLIICKNFLKKKLTDPKRLIGEFYKKNLT